MLANGPFHVIEYRYLGEWSPHYIGAELRIVDRMRTERGRATPRRHDTTNPDSERT